MRELPFHDDINNSRKERAFRGHAETYKVEVINNKSLNDFLYVSKNSIRNLFDDLLRKKKRFKYVLSTTIILKKRINDNEFITRTAYFNSLVKMGIN